MINEETETGPVGMGRSWDSSPDSLVPESLPRPTGLGCFPGPQVKGESAQAKPPAQPGSVVCPSVCVRERSRSKITVDGYFIFSYK